MAACPPNAAPDHSAVPVRLIQGTDSGLGGMTGGQVGGEDVVLAMMQGGFRVFGFRV